MFILILIYSPFTLMINPYDNLQSCLDEANKSIGKELYSPFIDGFGSPKVIAAFCAQGIVKKD
jgi:hypothetical protein